MSVRDGRKPPFAWVGVDALETIRRCLPQTRQQSARNAYLALAEAATARSDHDHSEGDPLDVVAHFACVSARRLREHLDDLATVGLVRVEQRQDAVGRDLASHYVILDAPGSDDPSYRADKSSPRYDGSRARPAAKSSDPTRGRVNAVEEKEPDDDLTDARVERAQDPGQLTERETEAINGLAAIVAVRRRFLTDAERRGILAAVRAAGAADTGAAVRHLERFYGTDGPGADRPITDIVALFASELARRNTPPRPDASIAPLTFRRAPRHAPAAPRALDPATPDVLAHWQRAREKLREAVSESTWSVWLESLALAGTMTGLVTEAGDDDEHQERVLVLAAPGNKLSWVTTRFRRLVTDTVAAEFGADVAIEFQEEGVKECSSAAS